MIPFCSGNENEMNKGKKESFEETTFSEIIINVKRAFWRVMVVLLDASLSLLLVVKRSFKTPIGLSCNVGRVKKPQMFDIPPQMRYLSPNEAG